MLLWLPLRASGLLWKKEVLIQACSLYGGSWRKKNLSQTLPSKKQKTNSQNQPNKLIPRKTQPKTTTTKNQTPQSQVCLVDKTFALKGKEKQDLTGFWPKDTYWKVSCEAGLQILLSQASEMAADTISALLMPSSDGYSLGCGGNLSTPHLGAVTTYAWVLIPVREGTEWSISYLRHHLAWHFLYFPSSKIPIDISRSLIPGEAEFLAS